VAVLVMACGSAAAPPEEATTSSPVSTKVNPARIDRVRTDVPDGYEIADLTGPVTPTGLWGFGAPWSADPPQCGPLANPHSPVGVTGPVRSATSYPSGTSVRTRSMRAGLTFVDTGEDVVASSGGAAAEPQAMTRTATVAHKALIRRQYLREPLQLSMQRNVSVRRCISTRQIKERRPSC